MTDQELLIEIWKHIQVLNDDYTQISQSVARLEARQEIILWILAAVAVATLGQFIASAWKKLFNNKK